METSNPQQLVETYIEAYNRFDVDGMVRHLHDDVVFKNVSNGEVTLATKGKEAFQQQAEQAKQYFSHREQHVTNWQKADSQIEVLIDYIGVAATEFPNGLKPGDTLRLQGKSIFQFADGKIVSIEDIS
ncbi:nuclear transport factor 2 family protein [Hymenobacter sp. GOD-10R]|uniref:nuclear transport factor 2 family protein n=1 Tax=Hymenobacter sp. GOD-10R TaxID=3093922 RepID=UPI002D78B5E2|nr:nuclear transport factor 2 family protein [Hymenobacter sp. GOD-10R]WRQ29063.1 nuclear transport factor 2 family protein [Hymenobacter sp. GOD-10R]